MVCVHTSLPSLSDVILYLPCLTSGTVPCLASTAVRSIDVGRAPASSATPSPACLVHTYVLCLPCKAGAMLYSVPPRISITGPEPRACAASRRLRLVPASQEPQTKLYLLLAPSTVPLLAVRGWLRMLLHPSRPGGEQDESGPWYPYSSMGFHRPLPVHLGQSSPLGLCTAAPQILLSKIFTTPMAKIAIDGRTSHAARWPSSTYT
ncbi:hypothetical protein B0T26DRAFT_272526 [Lasiosphaeria miniovina]|uniref:Uncharacterized protein n=1 Tax=Lasiosphaeria miniovina TaxID=1954250 RepID=A0AA40DVC6_9PEZI|nr:uncharacterized protein B0T26DRAFT_272526 [Lasiosphaeria miniovina]KAK0716975.1 hypothetical protein B0T26DRAFT_272526 [Lasiosphaeria miniovina]